MDSKQKRDEIEKELDREIVRARDWELKIEIDGIIGGRKKPRPASISAAVAWSSGHGGATMKAR